MGEVDYIQPVVRTESTAIPGCRTQASLVFPRPLAPSTVVGSDLLWGPRQCVLVGGRG